MDIYNSISKNEIIKTKGKLMLVSAGYKNILEEVHSKEKWGYASQFEVPDIVKIIKEKSIQTILDYGAGRQFLASELPLHCSNIKISSYEPGIPGLDNPPDPAELVCCIDVLEHVEPECIEDVLDDLKRVTGEIGYFTIATQPAKRILPDGRNAHILLQPITWWHKQIEARFDIIDHNDRRFIVKSKQT